MFKKKTFWLALLLSLIGAEILFRSVGRIDENGNFRFGTRTLKPYHLPLPEVNRRLNTYQSGDSTSFIVYHRQLGWIPRPDFESESGWYVHNQQGFRVARLGRQYAAKAATGTIRIAIAGDSYVYGDELPFKESLGAQLEHHFRQDSLPAEVINFGVGGYGLDQAMLRILLQSHQYDPKVVVLGLQPENLYRNLNLYRAFYTKMARNPFFKPRFHLKNNSLQLANLPCPAPGEITALLDSFPNWPLASLEHFYQASDYQAKVYRNSRLLAYAEDVWRENRFNRRKEEAEFMAPDGEAAMLSMALIDSLANYLYQREVLFMVVHLPRKPDLRDRMEGHPFPYQSLMDSISQCPSILWVNPAPALQEFAENESINALFEPRQHYSGKAQSIVAKHLYRTLKDENPGLRDRYFSFYLPSKESL